MSTSITAPRPSEHPWTSLPTALRVSRAQELAIDQRIDTPEIREHLVDLYGQRAHVRGVFHALPLDPAPTIDALQRSRDWIRPSLDGARAKLTALEQRHPIRHRKHHTAQRLTIAREVELLEARLRDTEQSLAAALERQQVRISLPEYRYVAERLPIFDREIRQRIDQLIDSYQHDPPAYLVSLGPRPADAEVRQRWMQAAHVIEDYRHERGITDPHNPLGSLDRANEYQRTARFQLLSIDPDLDSGRRLDTHRLSLDLD